MTKGRKRKAEYRNTVLFVQGIGSRQRGSYLANDAAAPEQALADRGMSVKQSPNGDTESDREYGLDWLEWDMTVDGRTQRWLLAEAWWAPAFDLPPFRQTLAWIDTPRSCRAKRG